MAREKAPPMPPEGRRALRRALKRLMKDSGMDQTVLNKRYGIGTSTLNRIQSETDASGIDRSTLSHLSLIFGLHHEYLHNLAYRLQLPGEPAPTLVSLRDEIREIRAEQRWQGDMISKIGPVLGVEVKPGKHATREERDETTALVLSEAKDDESPLG